MAYSKQTWTDDVSAVTGARMGHIEQGIYDNSTNIDTINNNVNPSGTATTTQTDYTEGQLTQKLGLKYLKMKGQTSQASDPTPTEPVDVNNVTGSNVLKVCNKNLYDKDDSSLIMQAFINGAGNAIQGAGTARTLHIPILPNTTYTVSKIVSARFIIGTFESYEIGSVGTQRVITYTNQTSGSITTGANDKYLCVFYYLSTADTLSEEEIRNSIQIEVGSTATTYTAHKEDDYEIDLPVENLAISNKGFPYTDRNVTYDYDNEKFIFSGVSNNNNVYMTIYAPTETPLFKSGDVLTIMNETNWKDTSRVELLNSSSSTISGLIVNKNTTATLTLSADVYGYRCWYNAANIKTFNGIYQKVQIERGTKIHAYTPYGTTPIELCKIGNYQDYIYKNNGKWYKHKAIGKVILDGTETWNYSSGNLVFYTDVINTLAKSNTSLYCTHYKPVDNSTTYANMNSGEIKAQHDNSLNARLIIKNTDITSANDFKTWLASNNTSIYYQLVTPIEEEITYEPLLRQLDKLDKIGLYDISNISQDNSDMKMLLDFTICNDNYNGLREFIRA